MFVDFLCADVSSLFPHLVNKLMFMPTKVIVSCSAISIVKFKFSWQEFNLLRKMLALLKSGMIVKVSSTYRVQKEGSSFLSSHFFSMEHMKVVANSGPSGEPMATPSTRS